MKAISLPTNLLVYVAIGIICALAVLTFLYFSSSKEPNYQMLYSNACLKLFPECSKDLGSVRITERGKTYTLLEICEKMSMNEEECRKGCGCG